MDDNLLPPYSKGRYVRVTAEEPGRDGHGYCISFMEVYGCELVPGPGVSPSLSMSG
jgi:hypothetical protein